MKRQKPQKDDYEYSYKRLGDKYSDDSGDEVELYQKKKTYHEPPTVEKVVEEGDTLQSLAIRYGCSVAELKRLNHILNDNEIFAKGVVKVPDRPFSAILAGVHSSGRSSPNAPKKITKPNVLESKLNDTLLNLPGTSKTENFNEIIFNSTISNKPCESINEIEYEYSERDEEVTLLPKTVVKPTLSIVKSKYTCSGADADVSWITMIILAIIVIIAVPLLGALYIYKHQDHYFNHTHTRIVNHTL